MSFNFQMGEAQTTYRQPPKAILDVLNAPETPRLYVSPAKTHAVMAERLRYPPIAELSEPMLRLAGVRVNPKTNGQHRATRYVGLSMVRLADGVVTEIGLPAGSSFLGLSWSPDGKRFAFSLIIGERIEPWAGETTSGKIKRVADLAVNAAFGQSMDWMPDSRTLLLKAVPAGRGRAPEKPEVPKGPVIQETSGDSGPLRTYQDLLTDEHDEALFDYYATSRLTLVDVATGKVSRLGKPAIYEGIDASPDGKLLLVERIGRPYSYQHPYYRFPYTVEVWDTMGKLVKQVAKLPLADNIPIEGVPVGPRAHRWYPLGGSTLYWVEALDEGDPKKKVPNRDKIMRLDAPFDGEPQEFARTEQRWMGTSWSERDDFVLVSDYDRDKKWIRTLRVNPKDLSAQAEVIWSRSYQDRYSDAGTPVTRTLPSGHRAIQHFGDSILLSGAGASPKGDHPFLDQFNWESKDSERLFHCEEGYYESVVAILDDDGTRLLTRRQSPTDPPNYYIRDREANTVTAITKFEDPAPQIRGITKRRVTYQRDDGVDLSFTLYLPPGYKDGEGEPLPTVMWAYPREFNTAKTAGQIRGTTKQFTLISGSSHLFYLLAGYAILDGATLPVVGDPETANDTYIEQIVAGAKAAIDKAAELGVTDPKRIGVGGHSYGAFMTANLLAHSDLFKAGVARSGAYNRTLTPFGFQAERRTFWEAPQIYFKLSPFMAASKINEPLLLIHGEADNNSGTFPVQSQRMYHAVKGNGGVVRLVMLPHESHGYAARESIEHVLAEMIEWFDKYVK
jgi:dipeptidyl aminopeptidase/acylaminoacyl peptidase